VRRAPFSNNHWSEETGQVTGAILPHEIVQRILHVAVEPIGEWIGEPALRRPGHPRLKCVDERAMAREPHRLSSRSV